MITKTTPSTLYYGSCSTSFGLCMIGIYNDQICYLSFPENEKTLTPINHPVWSQYKLIYHPHLAKTLITHIFKSPDAKAPMPLLLKGTPFQLKVWHALLKTKPGELLSYNKIATLIDCKNAARAVGQAVSQNRIAYLVPCHRIIKSSGDIGEYRWSKPRKLSLINWEKAMSNKT
jgi:AraC family transcriptional regulator of adaptative response/methylated-DNA-[protein]-cysteine methyltransferase